MSAGIPYGLPTDLSPEDMARLFGKAPMGAPQSFAGTSGTIQPEPQASAPAPLALRVSPRSASVEPPEAGGPVVPNFKPASPPASGSPAVPMGFRPPMPPPRPSDMPSADSVPVAGTVPAPAAAPAAAPSADGGFDFGGALKRFTDRGGGDLLVGLGTGLMSTRGFGNGLAAGFQNAQKAQQQRAVTGLAQAELGIKQRKLAQENAALGGNASIIKRAFPNLSEAEAISAGSNSGQVTEALRILRDPNHGRDSDPNVIRARAQAQAEGAAAGGKDDVHLITRPDGSIVAVKNIKICEPSATAAVTPVVPGVSKLASEADERRKAVVAQGGDPNDPRYKDYILSGSLPKENQQQLTAADKQAIREGEDNILSHRNALTQLRRGLDLSPKAYEGVTAGQRATFMTNWPEALGGGGEAAMATREFDNTMSTQMLDSLKAIFGGNPTEGERAALKDIQGISSMPHELREKVIRNTLAKVESRLGFEEQRVNDLRGGTYYKPRSGESSPAQAGPGGAEAAQAPSSRITQFRTQEEYAAAPSGTRFIAPDGKLRVKP